MNNYFVYICLNKSPLPLASYVMVKKMKTTFSKFCCWFCYWISGCYLHIWWDKCYNQCALDWHNIRQFSHIWWRLSDDSITWWHVHGMSLWRCKKCCTIKIFPFGLLLVRDTWQEAKTGSHLRCRRLGRLIYLFYWDKVVNPQLFK